GLHDRAGPVLPRRGRARPAAAARDRGADRGQRAGHRDRWREPLGGAAASAGRDRGMDGVPDPRPGVSPPRRPRPPAGYRWALGGAAAALLLAAAGGWIYWMGHVPVPLQTQAVV